MLPPWAQRTGTLAADILHGVFNAPGAAVALANWHVTEAVGARIYSPAQCARPGSKSSAAANTWNSQTYEPCIDGGLCAIEGTVFSRDIWGAFRKQQIKHVR